MTQRIDYRRVSPAAVQAMAGLQKYVDDCGLEASLLNLVKLRASQINGCAYCVDMHTLDARALGETEQRLYAVAVWREAPFFTERERAALAWTEEVTLISHTKASDAAYEEVQRHLNEKELVDLTMAIIAINGWNRLAVSFRAVAGRYHPHSSSASPRDLPRTGS
jgi:AhpD family alkylhydroperoxidase